MFINARIEFKRFADNMKGLSVKESDLAKACAYPQEAKWEIAEV
jgi:hypothetical protein